MKKPVHLCTGREIDEAEAARLLEVAQDAQTAFWKALGDLEAEIGIDVDGQSDLEGKTVNDLFTKEDDD